MMDQNTHKRPHQYILKTDSEEKCTTSRGNLLNIPKVVRANWNIDTAPMTSRSTYTSPRVTNFNSTNPLPRGEDKPIKVDEDILSQLSERSETKSNSSSRKVLVRLKKNCRVVPHDILTDAKAQQFQSQSGLIAGVSDYQNRFTRSRVIDTINPEL